MNKKMSVLAFAALAAVSMSLTASATPTTITFSDADGAYSDYVGNGPSQYHSQGYTFAAINPAGDNDRAHFHDNFLGQGTVLTHDNTGNMQDIWRLTSSAGKFDLISFTTLSNGLLWSVNGGASFSTVAGVNLVNVKNVSFLDFKLANPGACCSDGLDEFVVAASTSVPEPMSAALLGLGLAGMALRRRVTG